MDTLILVLYFNVFKKDLVEMFLMNSNVKKLNAVPRNVKWKQKNFFYNSRFRNQAVYENEGTFIFLQSDPWVGEDRIELTVHLKQIGDLKDLYCLFESVFGKEISFNIFTKAFISRLDICLLTGHSFDRLKRSFYKPGVRITQVFYSTSRTLILGTSNTNQVVIYDKRKYSRIELRMRKNLPISHLCEIPQLMNYNWNDEVKCLFIDERRLASIERDQPEKAERLNIFFIITIQNCLQYSLKLFNKDGNFKKQFYPLLKMISKEVDMNRVIANVIKERVIRDFDVTSIDKGAL